MRILKVGALFAASTLSRLFAGLLVVKVIAIYIGADGLGRLGQFMSLMSMITMLAGGGISTGIVKYVAEHRDNKAELTSYIGAASLVSVAASLLLGLCLLVGADQISAWLFKTEAHAGVVRVLALAQFAIAGTNLLLGLVNGHQRVFAFAVVNAVGAVLGCTGVAIGSIYFGIEGAMYGLVWMPACYFLLLLPWYRWGLKLNWRSLALRWDRTKVRQYLNFSVMLLTSVLTMQLAQVVIRNMIEAKDSWTGVGYWQATAKISDAYLLFITVVLANYYLPRLAVLRTRLEVKHEVARAYKLAIPALVVLALGVFVFRDLIILILFSPEFSPMRDFFTWQLLGDGFKVAAYVGAYVAVARADTRIHIAAEVFQAGMLVLLCYGFVGKFGAIGATYAYCVNYVIYFLAVQLVLRRYLSKGGAV